MLMTFLNDAIECVCTLYVWIAEFSMMNVYIMYIDYYHYIALYLCCADLWNF